jgi:hypothetical protein
VYLLAYKLRSVHTKVLNIVVGNLLFCKLTRTEALADVEPILCSEIVFTKLPQLQRNTTITHQQLSNSTQRVLWQDHDGREEFSTHLRIRSE